MKVVSKKECKMDLVLFSFNINVFTQHAILKPEPRSVMKLMPFIEEGFSPATEMLLIITQARVVKC